MGASAKWPVILLVWLGALPACGGGSPQATAQITITVDATAGGAPLERVWAFHGYDELNYTTVPEGRSLLQAIASAHTAPVYVRNHFLFNSGDGTPALKWGSTDVYREDADRNPLYDWTLTDGILDTFSAAGALPFVELGFMPQALSTHPLPYRNSDPLLLNGGCFYPPNDYSKWAELVRAWATHAHDRYGDVAAGFLWELWNEPDSGYFHGSFADYAKLYDFTESALHRAMPEAPLGGPAVIDANGPFLSQFLEHCASGSNAVTGETGTRLDLVTFHAKGGTAIRDGHVELDLGNQLRLHRAGFAVVAGFPEFARTPIYITEADPDGCAACPAAIVAGAEYRSSIAYGAYELAMMKRSLELETVVGVKLAGVLTWAFTFPGTPYFAGYRALATNGIDLPVFNAFKLLGRLSGERLPLTSSGALALDEVLEHGVRGRADVDGMATLDQDTIRALVWNYHDELVPAAASAVHLAVKVPRAFAAVARVSHLRVDQLHGDAPSAWRAQGMPANPSAEQIAALRLAMEPSLLEPDRTVPVTADGVVALDFELPRFGVSLITITPQ